MSAIPADLRVANPWRNALATLAGLLLAIGWLYRDTAAVMVDIWNRSETFAHCFLVLPITLWLVWRRRRWIMAIAPQPQPWVLPVMAVVGAAWLVADLATANVVAQFAFVTLLILAVPAVLGGRVARELMFPLLFLYFGVPFGEFLVPTLMEWTANFTVGALQLTGIPVFREGQHFIIPSGSWSVIDECSGVRYVMASFMVGSLFAYLNYRSYRRRAAFMLVALLLPVVANWLRAYMIVMLAHLSGNRIATGVDHILYGWVFFGIVVFAMFIIGARWSQPDEAAPEGNGGLPIDAGPGAARWLPATALGALAIALLPKIAIAAIERAEGAAAAPRLELPAQLATGWSAESGTTLPAFTPVVDHPSVVASRVYDGPKGPVGVHIAYFRGQAEDRKLVSSSNHLVGMRDRAWGLPIESTRAVKVGDQSLSVPSAAIVGKAAEGPGGDRLQVWRLYWVDGRFITSDVQAKLAGMVSRLRGHGDEGAWIVLYARSGEGRDADATLASFVEANLSPVGALLERTRSAR